MDFTETEPKQTGKKGAVICALLAVFFLLCACLSVYFFRQSADPYGGRILNNVVAADLSLGGMTKKEAKAALKKFKADLESTDMELVLPGLTLHFTPKETGATLDVDKALKLAFAYGRDGSREENHGVFLASRSEIYHLDLSECLRFRSGALEALVAGAAEACRNLYEEPSYEVVGQMPDLTREDLEDTVPTPTIIFRNGRSSLALNETEALNALLWAYGCRSFRVEFPNLPVLQKPEPLDIKAIGQQVNIAPVNFVMDKKTMEVIPGSFGCTFHVTTARRAVMKAGAGEEVVIPMTLQAPEINRQEAYFQDILGFCETRHGTNVNRNVNLSIAIDKLNGLILEPGEELSYNALLGQRTEAAGFRPAPAYSGTNLVNTPGGGICQVSSTLYLASMYAELTATERISHGFKPSYMAAGTDATVSWPSPDLKLMNPTDYPVKIKANLTDTHVQIWIMGTETRDYDVKIETSIQSESPTYIRSYIAKYDKVSGERLSRDFLAYSAYLD